MLKKIFRDIPSSVLLMIGFSLIIFITMLGCNLLNNIMYSKYDDNEVDYYYLGISHTERNVEIYDNRILTYLDDDAECVKYESIYDIMKEEQINFYNEYFVHVGDGQEQQFLATSIVSFDKTKPFELKSGYVDWSSKKTVIIGETIKIYMENIKNKDYLLIDGEYYEVTGILENVASGGYDSSIYFVNDNIYGNVPEAINIELEDSIMFGGIGKIVVFVKKREIIDFAKNKLEQQLPLSVSISDESSGDLKEEDIINSLNENLNKIFLPILLIFSIGSCCSISSLWIKVRKTDIAIKLTYGFSRFKIYRWILKELSALFGISLLFLLIIRGIYCALYSEISLRIENIILDTLIILGAMVITLVVTSFGAYRYSRLIVPATVLKEL